MSLLSQQKMLKNLSNFIKVDNMKKLLIIGLLIFSSINRIVLADDVTDLMAFGIPAQAASQIVKQRQPTPVVAAAALTPVATFGKVEVLPTQVANAGKFLPVVTPGYRNIIINAGANAQTVWPSAYTTGTPTPGTVLGFGTPVAAGTPASLPGGKGIECVGAANNVTYCMMGQ